MEGRGGLEDDGSMEDAMAEQEELESRVKVALTLLCQFCEIGWSGFDTIGRLNEDKQFH